MKLAYRNTAFSFIFTMLSETPKRKEKRQRKNETPQPEACLKKRKKRKTASKDFHELPWFVLLASTFMDFKERQFKSSASIFFYF